jgi:predicted Kef-type K+ transport protein
MCWAAFLIAPFTPGPTISDVHAFELFAEIGIVLLMFSIGIEFSLRDLLRVKWVAVGGRAPRNPALDPAGAGRRATFNLGHHARPTPFSVLG